MFRRRNPSSEDSIFNIDQNNVKSKINMNLAHIVKELQKEYPLSSSPIQSESSLAQHLCSVVESAFIHGLKTSNYEKEATKSTSKNNFPKPQFWNLILKISHAETINRVQALSYITTRIGKCRAWLRLTLNDGAVTSYLSSIYSKEQKSTLTSFYDSRALFLDQEHAEIFLRYLQGVESVAFELSYNSSMLNQWTKTPLELAGLVPPSTSAPLYLGIQASIENNNHSKPKAKGRLLSHRASAPALFSSSLPATSGPQWLKNNQQEDMIDGKSNSTHVKKNDAIQEVAEEEEDENDTSTPVATPIENDILHRRQLIKKNKRRKKTSSKEDRKNVFGSSWSSISSGEGSTTSTSTNGKNTPRTRSFCETPPTTVLQKKASEFAEKKMSSRIKKKAVTSPTQERHLASEISRDDEVFRRENYRTGLPRELKNKNLVLTPKREKKISSSSDKSDCFDPFKSYPPEVAIEKSSSTPSSGLEDSTGSQSSSNVDSKLNSQMPLPETYKISFMTSSSSLSGNDDPKVTEGQSSNAKDQLTTVEIIDVMTKSTDAIDIYANSIRDREDTFPPNSIELIPELDNSGLVGNSLSRGGGWSVPNTPDYQQSTPKSSIFGSVSQQNDESRMIEESHESLKWTTSRNISENLKNTEKIDAESTQNEIFIRREGYLRKLGEKLKLWKQRWFVLRGTTLNYYKDKSSDKILGTVDLTDVLTISEETFEKDADVVLVMNDGTEHHLAAEDKKTTLDWAADFLLVLAGPEALQKNGDKEHNGEDIFSKNYLDEYEVISIRNQHLTGTNTSWHAVMSAHMGKIANEKGLDAQNYQCADCASPFILFGAARVCTFTGQYYCSQCHANEESQIPARITHNWDFRKHKVAKRSKTFIEQFFDQPLIDLNESNPGIYKYIDEMGKVCQLRKQLLHLKPYLLTCRNFDLDDIITKLGHRDHFLEDAHIYSVQDMCNVHDKSLGNLLSKLVTSGMKHVYGCPLCSAKGFLCEICQNNKIIFPFETELTIQCFDCRSVYHRGCKNEDCPKCERRRLRMMKIVEYEKELTDSENDN